MRRRKVSCDAEVKKKKKEERKGQGGGRVEKNRFRERVMVLCAIVCVFMQKAQGYM